MDAMLKKLPKVCLGGDTEYFIEFAYNRLVALKCKKMENPKYLAAISHYKTAAINNTDPNKTTMDCIKDEKVLATIAEMMELYDTYSLICYEELADIYITVFGRKI